LLVSVDAPAKPGSDSGATAAARLSGRVQYWRWSPPLAGIKLLEDILGRVRSVPQLAMKTNLRMQNQEVAQQAMQGPTNYQLAIRPRESSWPQQAQRPTLMGKEARQAEDKDASAAKAKRAAPAGIWEKDATLADAANKRRTDVLAYGIAPAANPTAGFAGKSGIWEAEPKGLTPAQENLRRAASNLYGITRKLDAANQIASGGGYGGGVPGAVSKGVATVVRGELKARPQSAQRQWQVLDEAPIVRDSREKGIEEFRPSTDRGMTLSAMPPVATSAVPMSPDFGLDSMSAGQRHQPPARLESFTRADAQRPHGDEGQASREAEIALLPPNVFTGIPVVRLGSSEAQAARALAAVGSTNRQKINGWTVWSISKPASKDPALQVFMRHGQVDALRIFDGSLVGPDFGVRLGDSLAAVKERFGQPAFIIPEPTPGSGQNYVYPISQVAFLMARPAPNEAPVVTGLFLFTVK
jgi:hypothetical protein